MRIDTSRVLTRLMATGARTCPACGREGMRVVDRLVVCPVWDGPGDIKQGGLVAVVVLCTSCHGVRFFDAVGIGAITEAQYRGDEPLPDDES